jgi:hypothetical protein
LREVSANRRQIRGGHRTGPPRRPCDRWERDSNRSHHHQRSRPGGRYLQQQADLTVPNPQTGDLFGRSVAISGNTALIGSPGAGLSGAGYVFVRTGTTWTQQAALAASDPQSAQALAENSVAVSGNTAIAGADFTNSQTGAAYEFVRTGTTWAQKAKFTDPNGMRDDSLGFGEAIAGRTALVGAPGHDHLHGQVDLFNL